MAREAVLFASTMVVSPWGGSEELWSRAAVHLVQRGFEVHASVCRWSSVAPRIEALAEAGVQVHSRPRQASVLTRARRRLLRRTVSADTAELMALVRRTRPSLLVISEGGAFPPVEWMEFARGAGLPYVTVSQANHVDWWADDGPAERLRAALSGALRCCFVSQANLELACDQFGGELANAEVVRNPFNVAPDAAPPWPTVDARDELRLACVARLYAPAKGQDLLLQALASPSWRARNWRLTLYGEGQNRGTLGHMAERLGIGERVVFAGQVEDIAGVWAENHALALTSRYEGLPLALAEAMLCGRAVLATDVAGNGELVQDDVTGFLAEAPTVCAVSATIERLWKRRGGLQRMGAAAADRARRLLPADPAEVFADRLVALMSSGVVVPPQAELAPRPSTGARTWQGDRERRAEGVVT